MTYGNIRSDWYKVLKRSGRKRADPAMKTNTEAWGTDTTTTGGSHPHSAENVSIDDAGSYYISGHVEGALQEIGAGGIGGTTGVAVEEDGTEEGTGIDRFDFSTGLDVSVTGTQATISATGGGGGGSIDGGYYAPVTTGESPGEFVFDDNYDIVMGWIEGD